jgi:hypothetical protein
MKRDRKRVPAPDVLSAAVIAVCAALAAACAGIDTSMSVPPHSPSASPSRPATAAGQTPKQRADADAAAILAAFVAPPGAVKLSRAPSVGNGLLKHPDGFPEVADLVDDADWWQAPGGPRVLLGWEKSHLPRQFWDTGYATQSGQDGSLSYYGDDFQLPANDVLNQRTLVVEAVDAGDGKTDFRVDAQVTWIPARPASEVVPSAARAVTLSLLPNLNVHTKLPAPVTITDPGQVRAITALIDGLPEFPPGVYSCPADFGSALVLTFRARPGGPALAVATVELSGCEGVDFTIGGQEQPGLGGVDQGRQEAAQVLEIARLPWKIS